MIWGYYDESGEYDSAGKLLNMTIGACFAPLDRWQTFDVEWRECIAREGLKAFHMTDFEGWVGPFDFRLPHGERDKEKHNRILNSLLDIMLRHIEGFYGFGAVSMFDPDLPPQTHENLMEDCVGGAIKNAVLDVADFYQQPLSLVFARQEHFAEVHIRKYVALYDWAAAGRIKSLSMGNVEDIRPLQAADIFAYEMARAQRRGRPERYPFQRLVDGVKTRGLRMVMNWGPIRLKGLNLGS